jgi:hypothetical protein
MSVKRNNIKVFVASTVYNFQSDLNRIYNLLDGLGYDVFMSHKGTIPLDSSKSCATVCTDGVETCDVFLGFIRPDYGSGVLEKGGDSITHMEFKTAIQRNIPRFVLCDYRVTFTRNLFKDSFIIENFAQKKIQFANIAFQNKVMDTRCVTMYNVAIKDKKRPPAERTGNWVQEYYNYDDVKMHVESQFKHHERIQKLINNSKSN